MLKYRHRARRRHAGMNCSWASWGIDACLMPALPHLALPLPIACLLSSAAHSTTTINKSIQSKHDSRCINSSDDFEASISCSGLHSPSYLPIACNSSAIPLILRQLQASPRGKIIRHHTSDRSISICFFRINSRGHHHEHGFAAAREPCYSKLCGASRLGGCDLCELHASAAARVFCMYNLGPMMKFCCPLPPSTFH